MIQNLRIMIRKSLKELALNITEPEYRALPMLSYSGIAKYAREGVGAIPRIGEKIETPSLLFGSLVDCLLTEPETYDDRFYVSNLSIPGGAMGNVIKEIAESQPNNIESISEVPTDILLEFGKSLNARWKDKTKIDNIVAEDAYFKQIRAAKGKIIISSELNMQANACVNTLKTSPYTKVYFLDNFFNDDMEYLYQQKFSISDPKLLKRLGLKRPIKCMFDLTIVDHKNKVIIPIDLKTTGDVEENFFISFKHYRYDIQATLYTFILQTLCNLDPYFKDFKFVDFRFICINKMNLAPIVWKYHIPTKIEDITLPSGYTYKCWKTLVEEMNFLINEGNYKYNVDTLKNNGEKELSLL